MDIAVGGRRRGRGSCELKGRYVFCLARVRGNTIKSLARVDSPTRFLLFSFAESPRVIAADWDIQNSKKIQCSRRGTSNTKCQVGRYFCIFGAISDFYAPFGQKRYSCCLLLIEE